MCPQGELGAEEFVDEVARLPEARIDDLPEDVPVLAATAYQSVSLKDGEVLGDVGPAHLQQLGQFARRPGTITQVMHELVSRRVGERGEHGGVDGVSLAVIVRHEFIIAKFRNFATWQLHGQVRTSLGARRSRRRERTRAWT
jgi:hypothetical protein